MMQYVISCHFITCSVCVCVLYYIHYMMQYVISLLVQCVCAGIFRGCGRQLEGAVIMTLGYLVGMTIGVPLMFKTYLQVKGVYTNTKPNMVHY